VGILVSQLVDFGDDVKFAISSGGHATAFGASNVDDGITLDLSALDSVSLASDRSYVDVGTGARWLDVYRALDPWDLTVAGGRAASLGVGGFLLGGM
jgi:FAD/FMN-containing dehydrogenase